MVVTFNVSVEQIYNYMLYEFYHGQAIEAIRNNK